MKNSSFIILLLSFSLPALSQQPRFIWPVRGVTAYSEVNDVYTVNNFVDQNTTAGIQDWNCGTRTYNGHRGIDIDLWPFTWSMMDNNYVAVVAAAAGRVARIVQNINNESNCGQAGENTTWNYIAIRHADSSTSIYGHIRTNSAQVREGENVAAGQIIAFVGSSGNSSNPHLHFEVNRNNVNDSQANGIIDPYTGTCNTLNANSWWSAQKPYWEPSILRVMTHSTTPRLLGLGSTGPCRTAEAKNARAAFAPNDSIYFGVAMRDYRNNQSFTLTVFDPNGGTWFSETNTNTSGDQERWYVISRRRLPGNAIAGTYRAVVTFNGTSSTHFFTVNCLVNQTVFGVVSGTQGFKVSNSITSTVQVNAGNRLLLQAGTSIRLLPGFVARNGSVFKARIRDCNYSE